MIYPYFENQYYFWQKDPSKSQQTNAKIYHIVRIDMFLLKCVHLTQNENISI